MPEIPTIRFTIHRIFINKERTEVSGTCGDSWFKVPDTVVKISRDLLDLACCVC